MKIPRLFGWLIATVILIGLIALLSPQQLPVSLYKLSLVVTAGVVGYWLDRSLFPYARPDNFTIKLDPAKESWVIDGDGMAFALTMIRRAIIVGCAMLAMGLGA